MWLPVVIGVLLVASVGSAGACSGDPRRHDLRYPLGVGDAPDAGDHPCAGLECHHGGWFAVGDDDGAWGAIDERLLAGEALDEFHPVAFFVGEQRQSYRQTGRALGQAERAHRRLGCTRIDTYRARPNGMANRRQCEPLRLPAGRADIAWRR